MIYRYYTSLLFAVICAVGLYLLGTETAVRIEPTHVAASNEVPKAEPTKGAEQQDEDQTPVDESPEEDPQELASTALDFKPPFPDRVSMFQAPKRQGRGRIKQQGKSESAIELLGFVNVNGPRVALSIDGLVATIAEGGSENGIEVVTIQPPSVVLKRSQQRSGSWVLSTEY